jgi:DNA-directed RNA polymerase sigma subunit (sigma70/sigma32)
VTTFDVVSLVLAVGGVLVGIYGIRHGDKQSRRLEEAIASRLDRALPQEVVRRVREGPDDGFAALFGEGVDAEQVRMALRSLPLRERAVFTLRFFDSMTLSEIGGVFGITRERVRQIEAETIRTLRAVFASPAP